MAQVAREQTLLLIHSEKHALLEANTAAPECDGKRALGALLARVGTHDGNVAFSADVANYITATLIPWAHENSPFGEGARGRLGMRLLDNLAVRLGASS